MVRRGTQFTGEGYPAFDPNHQSMKKPMPKIMEKMRKEE
jgi:hypothetical protein